MKYRYRTWCRYCRGNEDSVCGDDLWPSDESYDTPEQATQAVKTFIEEHGEHLDYCIVDEEGNEIDEAR